MERATTGRGRMRSGAAAAGALLVLLGPAALPAAAAERPERAFTIHDKRITESSGLAASRAHPGVYWTHNDSDDGPYVYAVDSEGRTVATVTLRGIRLRDAEAISLGPDGRLYVGDIGDNLDGTWPEVWIYAFPEPAELHDQTVTAVRYKVRYEDGPRDAEALMVHPVTGRAYIASKKQSGGGLYQGPEALSPTGVNTFRRIADVPWVTDGAFSPDGRRLVLRGYFAADLYSWDGMPKKLRALDVPFQRQGESVTFSADGTAVLYGSEGGDSDVWRLRLAGDGATARSGSPTAAPSGGAPAPSGRAASGSGPGGGSDHALAALIAVAAALGLAKLWSGRKKGN